MCICNERLEILDIGLVFVISDTHKEMVTSPSPQLENPMSIPLANPVSDIFCNDVRKSISIRDLPVHKRYTIRITNEMINLTTKWHSTMNRGNLNSCKKDHVGR